MAGTGGANAGTIKARLILENSDFRRSMQQARQDMKNLKNDTSEVKKASQDFNRALLGVGAGLVAVVGASINSAARFEQAMAKVKAISGATGSEFEQLKQVAIDLGNKTQYSATEAAQGMALLAAAGYKTKDIIAAMPGLLNLAAASGLDLATSADYLTSIMAGFNLKAKDSAHAVDVLVQAMNDSNAELTDIAESMKYVGPVAGQLGVSLEDTAAAIALMSNYGIKGSQAGTTLRMSFERLISPTKKAQELMDKYGISLKDANGHLKPLPVLLDYLHDKLGKLTKEQRQQFLTTLVGIEAMTGFSVLVDQGGQKLASFSNNLKHADGSAQQFANTMKNTLMGQWEQFTSALDTLGINIGNQFLPEAKALLEFGTNIVNLLSQVNPEIIEFGLKMAAGATSALLLKNALAELPALFRTIQLAMGPEGWLIAALGALAGLMFTVSDETQQSTEVNLEHAKSLQQQSQSLQQAINEFDQLAKKNRLSTQELARFVDIQQLLKTQTDPNVIARLRKEQETLQKKSGLSNQELNRLIQLNDQIADAVPNATRALSSQGKALIVNTDAAKQYNAQLQKQYEIELRKQVNNATNNLTATINQRIRLQQQMNQEMERYNQLVRQGGLIDQQRAKVKSLEKDYLAAIKRGEDIRTSSAIQNYLNELATLSTLEKQKDQLSQNIVKYDEEINKIDLKISKGQEAISQLIQMYLKQVGITAEKGKEVDAIQQAINKTNEQIKALEQVQQKSGKLTDSQQKELQALKEKKSMLESTKTNVENLIRDQNDLAKAVANTAGKAKEVKNNLNGKATMKVDADTKKAQAKADAVKKDIQKGATKPVNINDKGGAKKLHADVSKGATKNVKVTDNGGASKLHQNVSKGATKNVQVQSSNYSSWLDKITATVTKYVHLVASWVGGNPFGSRHSGGTVHELPKYHDGGIVDPQPATFGRLGTPPKFDEVDVRLLRNEMVLTAAQQANLFRMIQTFDYAQAQRVRELMKPKEERVGDGIIINIGSMTVREEADIRKIAQELERQTRIRQRARGEYI